MRWLLKLALPHIIRLIVDALDNLSHRTTNTIDDDMVHSFIDNQEAIIEELKNLL